MKYGLPGIGPPSDFFLLNKDNFYIWSTHKGTPMKFLLAFLFTFVVVACISAPYHGQIQRFKQPDGSVVEVRLFGTEFYLRAESQDGYTLIRDPKTNWICYARLSDDHSVLLSTGIRCIGNLDDHSLKEALKDIPKHVDIDERFRLKKVRETALALSGGDEKALLKPGHPHLHRTPYNPLAGKIKGLTVVIDFPDEPATLPMSEFDAFCNDTNYSNFGNNGSLRTYYRDISGGKLDYTNVVRGYFRAPNTFASYDAMPYATGAQILLKQALLQLQSEGFDFSSLTLNPDSSIMAINMMYTGDPPTWAEGMWYHMGNLTNFTLNSGIKAFMYNCSPANDPLGIGTVAHENGHMIGKWPDTYKYTSTAGVDGIGAFDLMCSYGNPFNPTIPNPLFRNNVNWGKVIDLTDSNKVVYDTANSRTSYSFRNLSDTNEFYLVESRLKQGRSQFIPDEGLTIWRINRAGDNQTTNHEVRLISAVNSPATVESACFHAPNRTNFSQTTLPTSNWTNGDQSGFRISGISGVLPVMNYRIGALPGESKLKMSYQGIVSDPNQNGFIEPGETIQFGIEVKNIGLAASNTVNLVCLGTSSNTNLYSILTSSQPVPILQPDSVYRALVAVQVIPSSGIGKEITLRFQMVVGNQTTFITRKYILGINKIMLASLNDSVCEAVYFDPGGPYSNYETYSDVRHTLFPKTAGSKLRVTFNSFRLETTTGCTSDYLRIYDGPNTNSALLGSFCSTTQPGTHTSSHSTGALTFELVSDSWLQYAGWQATLSCFTALDISQPETHRRPLAFPNPATGKITVPVVGARAEISLRTLQGTILLREIQDRGHETILDVSSLPASVYFLHIVHPEGRHIQKVVVTGVPE